MGEESSQIMHTDRHKGRRVGGPGPGRVDFVHGFLPFLVPDGRPED